MFAVKGLWNESPIDWHTDVTYKEEVLKDVLIRGIEDLDIQMELLGSTNQSMPLETVLHFIEAKEAGKRSATRLIPSLNVEAIRSTYKRFNSQSAQPGSSEN